MRINSQSMDVMTKPVVSSNASAVKISPEFSDSQLEGKKVNLGTNQQVTNFESKDTNSKEQLEQAVTMMNDLLDNQKKTSKFVFHEGLDKYYVKLVDSETEEIIKEIPPERLLDAFYEMQKLAGMIVDEKI